jgi:predicted DsbA family dithiol-disulfide isomerase
MNTKRFKIVTYFLALVFSRGILSSCSQIATNLNDSTKKVIPLKIEKMKVEIWSDVMCPFCYIGKRKFEAALGEFKNKENIEIVWKSFQLNADLKTDPSKNTIQHLAETKGWTMEYTRNTINYVMDMASGVGLNYDFDKAVVANSFDAHRFIQFAKTKGKGDAAEEVLFKAYFTEGKNTADHTILIQLAQDIGLESEAVKTMLNSTEFTNEVNHDVAEAQQIGVTGVPFFVVDRKYAVSGAQDSKVFLETLEKAWKEHAKQSSETMNTANDGSVCTPDGECK